MRIRVEQSYRLRLARFVAAIQADVTLPLPAAALVALSASPSC
jgi:hypothetical protein